MKSIFFLRHGEADNYGESDFVRKLTDIGKKQVINICRKFAQHQFQINYIISSSAIRAKETAETFRKKLPYTVDLLFEDFLYEDFSTQDFIEYVIDLPQQFNTILLVGHNPTISNIVSNLSSSLNASMKPADLIGLKFDIGEWNQIEARKGILIFN
jgi:phosphohistidine phosphatase